MQEPWSSVIGEEANGDSIPNDSSVDYVTANGVHVVIGRVPRASDDAEGVLQKGKSMSTKAVVSKHITDTMQMERVLRRESLLVAKREFRSELYLTGAPATVVRIPPEKVISMLLFSGSGYREPAGSSASILNQAVSAS